MWMPNMRTPSSLRIDSVASSVTMAWTLEMATLSGPTSNPTSPFTGVVPPNLSAEGMARSNRYKLV
jgi:hypothetical protein